MHYESRRKTLDGTIIITQVILKPREEILWMKCLSGHEDGKMREWRMWED